VCVLCDVNIVLCYIMLEHPDAVTARPSHRTRAAVNGSAISASSRAGTRRGTNIGKPDRSISYVLVMICDTHKQITCMTHPTRTDALTHSLPIFATYS
jgi:hypothetical protein